MASCPADIWIETINLVMNGAALWVLVVLFAELRRLEKRFEVLLHGRF